MLPTVIPEVLTTSFKYWQGEVKVGMHYRNELFAQVKSYGRDSRPHAYEDACQLAAKGLHVCITVSDLGYYCLWQNLRSFPPAPHLCTAEEEKALTHL